jgi:hypothetical protein
MTVSLYLLMLVINLYTAFFSAQFAGIVKMLPQIFCRPVAGAGRQKLTQSQLFAL